MGEGMKMYEGEEEGRKMVERMGEGGVRKGDGWKGRVIEELKERKEKEGIGGIGY